MALSNNAKKSYEQILKQKKQAASLHTPGLAGAAPYGFDPSPQKQKKKHWFFLYPGDTPKEAMSKLFTQLMAVVLLACGVILFEYFRAMVVNSNLNSSLQGIYGGGASSIFSPGEVMDSAKKLLAINPDTVGWVKIDGTKVDLPVVQKPGDPAGNTYYLTHNFNGNTAKAGTVFLDYRASFTPKRQSQNLVLYGHNEADNSMFGDLDQYKHDIEFYRAHPIVQFHSNYETAQYKIFAVFVTTVEESQERDGVVFDYHNYIDMDKNTFQWFLGEVRRRTQINAAVDVGWGDSILTLSTCSNEFEPSRLVVMARKLRPGESPAVDTASATVNQNALQPDFNYIYYGR